MSRKDFLTGKTVPLSIPACVRPEWAINELAPAVIAELEAECADNRGYEFEWGQIIEDVFDGQGDEGSDPNYRCLCWSVVLADLHNEFLDAGANLGELADCALGRLECIGDDPATDIELDERCGSDGLPDYIEFDEGNDISAFDVWVSGVQNIERARRWMNQFFLPGAPNADLTAS